jgi:hypothetical protein
LPDALAQYRSPKNKPVAKAGVLALIQRLEKQLKQDESPIPFNEAVTVGEWASRFTEAETSLSVSPKHTYNDTRKGNRPPRSPVRIAQKIYLSYVVGN